ncbi:ribonuclease T2-like protein [Podospora appendiculata]|uniref:ribonuclease T2 n=1 Tax=Podospora appendiculata TaxID=314037 RepID=A0AAE0X7M5_9PEZI|nr:ribonuclease T2-like protein [Podospora appendiculata]
MARTALLLGLVASIFFQTALAGLYGESNLNHTCAIVKNELSCSANAVPGLVDSCCVETFGGLVLATQFWSTWTGLESEGQLLPKNSWTLHGLWPDFCNGSYTQYCDLSRQYDPEPSPKTTTGTPSGTPVPPYTGPGIGTFLATFGKFDLLAWMNKYWIAQAQPNQDFWGHEFSKHATCFSTFDTECYGPSYQPHEEVVDFFTTAITFFQRLPTFAWLAADGIRPSNTTSYTLSKIQASLTAHHGGLPFVGCTGPRYNATAAGKGSLDNGFTQFSEVWYYYHVAGRPQRADGVPVDTGSYRTNCAKAEGAVWYYQRARGSETCVR